MGFPPASAESTCLISGASSGIGAELARALARRGHGVTLVARRKERLDELAQELSSRHGVRIEVIVRDLAEPGERDALENDVRALGLTVEVLCNNAGFGSAAPFV